MKFFTFRGGVHPDSHKLTDKLPIKKLSLPKRVVLPVQQHIGASCEPLVQKGTLVKTGQKIADSQSFVSAPIHSSISGTVVDIKKFPHPLGQNILSIVIESDGKDEWCSELSPQPNWESLSIENLKKIIREAGIVGLGGATFPTHVKLSPPKDKKVDTLLINGIECEPYLTSDHRLMIESSDKILSGTKIVQKILGAEKVFIGIESNKPDAIEAIKDKLRLYPGIQLVVLKTKYPQGSEKQFIDAITRRQVPIGGLPWDVGVVVQNVGTVLAIHEAIVEGIPLIKRIVTVTGTNIKNPSNFEVRLGMSFKEVIEAAGGYHDEVGKVIMGGPMMGIAVSSTSVPVVKGTSGIIVFSKKDVKYNEPQPCIRCGKCILVCPMGLSAGRIVESSENKNFDKVNELNILNCMECGSCVYICPAHRPLVQWIKLAKNEIQKKKPSITTTKK